MADISDYDNLLVGKTLIDSSTFVAHVWLAAVCCCLTGEAQATLPKGILVRTSAAHQCRDCPPQPPRMMESVNTPDLDWPEEKTQRGKQDL